MPTCVITPLPAVNFNYCAPSFNFGEIDNIYLGNPNNPFTDWSDLSEWNARIDNADTADQTKIRSLHVVGSKDAGDRTEIDVSKGRKVYTDAANSIAIRIDETTDENYALIKWLEDNAGSTVQLWYQAGKYLYGGNDGLAVNLVLDDIIPESDEELNVFSGTASWDGGHPDRIANPMA